MEHQANKHGETRVKAAKAVGWAAFLFFLIKGLLWLIVPAVIAYFAVSD